MKKAPKKKVAPKKVYKRPAVPQDQQTIIAMTAVENAQNKLSLREVQGEVIDKWVYSFPKDKNKPNENIISGLTFWGYVACAIGDDKKHRWKPDFSTKPDLTVISPTAVTLMQKVKNPRTGQVEWGIGSFNPTIRFDDRKALTIAKRYAMDKHILPPLRISFIKYVLAYEPEKVLQVTEGDIVEAKAEVVKTEPDKVKELRFIFTRISALKLDRTRMHAHLRKSYKTKHLKDLDIVKLKEINAGLLTYQKSESLRQDLIENLKELSTQDLKEWGGDQ